MELDFVAGDCRCFACCCGGELPERTRQPGVPQGKTTTGEFSQSRQFPGTKRQYSVYVPAQYREDRPANLMVFMDGSGYAKEGGDFRVPIVFDNLIHQQAMPVTIGLPVSQRHRAFFVPEDNAGR